jgi:hypothetical protein
MYYFLQIHKIDDFFRLALPKSQFKARLKTHFQKILWRYLFLLPDEKEIAGIK